ncbi:MAG: hypothetical protein VXZ18_19395, partial [Pseudomonadota bacterium]|nr:hypothetical protein [Pseudomonadota bacterium]
SCSIDELNSQITEVELRMESFSNKMKSVMAELEGLTPQAGKAAQGGKAPKTGDCDDDDDDDDDEDDEYVDGVGDEDDEYVDGDDEYVVGEDDEYVVGDGDATGGATAADPDVTAAANDDDDATSM